MHISFFFLVCTLIINEIIKKNPGWEKTKNRLNTEEFYYHEVGLKNQHDSHNSKAVIAIISKLQILGLY